jgi:beta-glucosidase
LTPSYQTPRGIAACVNEIRQRAPNTTILLTAITPRNTNGTTNLMPTINQINVRTAALADGTHVRFLNINDKLADATGKLLPGMTEDGLHLSNQGYQVWADAMSPILTEWLGPRATTQATPAAPSAEQ